MAKIENLNLSDIINILNDLEERFEVDEWEIDGVHVWPLVRMSLRDGLSYNYIKAQNKRKSTLQMIREVVTGNIKYFLAAISDHKKNLAIKRRTDVVILGDGASYLKLDNKWYERFCDPVAELFHEMSISTIRWDTYHHHYHPRYSSSSFIQPRLDYIVIKEMFQKKREIPFSKINNYEACRIYYAGLGLSYNFPDLKEIRQKVTIIRALANFFKKKLQIVNPRIAFEIWYYGIYGYSFTLACRELGIPVVDIQHGVQGEMHAAYGRWNKVPLNGYNILPDFFMVWSTSEAMAIDKWSSKIKIHKPIISGNLFLNKWLNGDSEHVRRYDLRFREIYSTNQPTILFTMSPRLDTEEIIGNVITVIKQTQLEYQWLIRLHPLMLNKKSNIASMLTRLGISRFEIEHATELPLYSLLRGTNLHITYSSSAVIEAEQFDVPSIITSDYGMSFYKTQIDRGTAFCLKEPDDIIEKIKLLISSRGNFKSPIDHNTLEINAIRELSKKTGII